jgi:hypothetical protein
MLMPPGNPVLLVCSLRFSSRGDDNALPAEDDLSKVPDFRPESARAKVLISALGN